MAAPLLDVIDADGPGCATSCAPLMFPYGQHRHPLGVLEHPRTETGAHSSCYDKWRCALMTTQTDALLDLAGRPLFRCSACGEAIGEGDIIDQGLRLPEPGESRDEYMEAELVDEFRHRDCLASRRAG